MPPRFRRSYPAAPLVAQHPPRIGHPNKRVLLDIACAPEVPHGGTLEVTRWAPLPLPDTLSLGDLGTLLDARPDLYDYQLVVPGAVEWHLNFADPVLFVAYDSPLFAQDEMQVAEHPALGSLREALEAEGVDARTVTREGPTPVLIKGVERRCAVDTAPDAAAGRPMGLYGNAFALADEDAVRRATRAIVPPTISNIIAIAAPRPGRGRYRRGTIEEVLVTAGTGFSAAVHESAGAPTVVHTGYWGCGAYGGNRELMALLQLLAARMAGVHRLVFHAFDEAGMKHLARALVVAGELGDGPVSTAEVVGALEARGYPWGVSDGN